VAVNIETAAQDKLVVVRDLSPMVKMQKEAHSKQLVNNLMNQIVSNVQSSAELCSIQMQKLESYVKTDGVGIAENSLNEIKKILYTIRDF
jgi:hypothetical protein